MKYRFALFIGILICLAPLCAQQQRAISSHIHSPNTLSPISRTERLAPHYNYSIYPTPVFETWFDYFMNSYWYLPLRRVPLQHGGGYVMSYHAMATPTALRRIRYAYITEAGFIAHEGPVSALQMYEGYPSITFDPVLGRPIIAWHSNVDTDDNFEIIMDSDTFGMGTTVGNFLNPRIAMDNPCNFGADLSGEFLWPGVCTGPSPIAGKRRLYVMGMNRSSYSNQPASNVMIAMTDFDNADLDSGQALNWQYNSIAELDAWPGDSAILRRGFFAMNADDSGKLYISGYHHAYTGDFDPIFEDNLSVFINQSYGEGSFRRVSMDGHLPVWNPPTQAGLPYFSEQPKFDIANSGHLNTAIDAQGRIHSAGSWGLHISDAILNPSLQVIKQFIYDPISDELNVNEIYPISKNPAAWFTPWDIEAPFGEVDEYDALGNPMSFLYFPFPHPDTSLHSDAMMFHYNNVKITNANPEGMMACVWQSVEINQSQPPPKINIAVSSDNGDTWTNPISISGLENPEFAGQIPVWVHPADAPVFESIHNGYRYGRLGLMYLDDNTWGARDISPPVHMTNTGGTVMFSELKIAFPGQGLPTGSFQLSVTDLAGTPIPNASISLGDSSYITSGTGTCEIPELCVGTWDLGVRRFGYVPSNTIISITAQQTNSFVIRLEPLPPISISGRIVGSDLPDVGIPGVSVHLVQPFTYQTQSNAEGYFSIPALQPGNYFILQISMPNYAALQHQGLVPETDTNLGTITLEESISSPQNMVAILQEPRAILLTWDADAPVQSTKIKALGSRSITEESRYPIGFMIYRFEESLMGNEMHWTTLNAEPHTLQNWLDEDWESLPAGIYRWAVKRIYNSGFQSIAAISNAIEKPLENPNNMPPIDRTALREVYPNPCKAVTTILYSVKEAAFVDISLYNSKGQKLHTIISGMQPTGFYREYLFLSQGKNLPSGVYFIRMRSGNYKHSKKLIIIK